MRTGIGIILAALGLVLLALAISSGPRARGAQPDPTVEAQPIAWEARFAGLVASDGAWAPVAENATTEPDPQVAAASSKELTPLPNSPSGCPALIWDELGWPGCAISWCESGWDANATGGHGERGWFQVHPVHRDSTYDPAGNVAAAVRISGGGADWGPWTTSAVLATGVCENDRGAVPG